MMKQTQNASGGKPQWKSAAKGAATWVRLNIDQIIPYVILAILLVLVDVLRPGMLASNWLANKADGTMTLILAASAQSFVMLIKGMDLSIAGIICVVNSVSALYMPDSTLGIIGMVLAMMLFGVLAGALNGLIVIKFNLQPFIATLATWSIWCGAALWILPIDGGAPPKAYMDVLLARIGGVPVSLFLIIALLLGWSYLRRTRFGISIFAVGNNEKSAFYSGINVNRIKVSVFAISGLLSAWAGLFRTAHVSSGSPTAGNGFLLLTLCAAVIGGINVAGGRGSLYGTVMGSFIMQIIADMLLFGNVSSYWTALVQGCLLIAAVSIASILNIMDRKKRMEVR